MTGGGPNRRLRRTGAAQRWARMGVLILAAAVSIGWNHQTIRHVAWTAVDFFPPDLQSQVRRHHRRFDAGLARGLEAQPSWRAAAPGYLAEALSAQASHCAAQLREPVPLEDLVEELGVLAVRVLDANDPLAVAHADPREPNYAADYARYADSVLPRVRLVYYGLDQPLVYGGDVNAAIERAFVRGSALYEFVGAEYYRTGSQRSWRDFDDKSVAFGVVAVSLSRALTDLANYAAWVWRHGGGKVPAPRPTPEGHVGPTLTVAPLDGGFPERARPPSGKPVMPVGTLVLPPP